MGEVKPPWWTEHGAILRAFFGRRTRRPEDAAELTQEVFVRMLSVPDLGAIQDLRAYLFTVAHNLLREHRLRERRAQASVDVDDPSVQGDLSEVFAFGEQIDTEQRTKRLHEVLRELSATCRAAVILHYVHGLTYEQTAQRLGKSREMVKKYLHQALLHCRRRMGRLR